MENILETIKHTHLHKEFNNSYLVEKSLLDWSKKYLEENTLEDYIDKIYTYCRTIEAIELEEIEDANKYKKMQRIFKLLDRLQLTCDPQEQKLFAIEDLRMTYYYINPFIYGLMLLFYDIKETKEIDKKITFITHWLDDVAQACERQLQKKKK